MKVHLRKRKQTKNGSISLYLEIYKGTTATPEGKTKILRDYEYLDLYLIDKPRNPVDKQHNKETLQLAQSIKAKRELEIKNGQYGFASSFKADTNFIQYFKEQAEKRLPSKGSYANWDSSLKHLIRFAGEKVTFREIDTGFCERFKEYLINKAKISSGKNLSSSSTSSYFSKFRACLKKAVKEKVILSNPCDDVSNPKVVENKREYLTLDELKAVAQADCRYDVLKRAFLFSCLTGLRWSDIQKLLWSEVRQSNDGCKIVFNQQKTKKLEYLDVSKHATIYLGDRGNSNERVFQGLKYSAWMNVALQQWVLRAGITKKITFHCARHTFAVMQLTLKTEIYTLKELLGHRHLKTTEIYSEIVNSLKKEAVDKIPDIST